MMHPLTWWSSPYRWVLFVILLIGTGVLAFYLYRQGKPLITDDAPDGILSYEFAWTKSEAEQILNSWQTLKDTARPQLLWDFAYLLFYPLLLSLSCAMLAESGFNRMTAVGIFISWAVLAASPLDALENIALLRMLDRGASETLAQLAGWCAGAKFVLVYAGFGYILLQGISVLVSKLRAE